MAISTVITPASKSFKNIKWIDFIFSNFGPAEYAERLDSLGIAWSLGTLGQADRGLWNIRGLQGALGFRGSRARAPRPHSQSIFWLDIQPEYLARPPVEYSAKKSCWMLERAILDRFPAGCQAKISGPRTRTSGPDIQDWVSRARYPGPRYLRSYPAQISRPEYLGLDIQGRIAGPDVQAGVSSPDIQLLAFISMWRLVKKCERRPNEQGPYIYIYIYITRAFVMLIRISKVTRHVARVVGVLGDLRNFSFNSMVSTERRAAAGKVGLAARGAGRQTQRAGQARGRRQARRGRQAGWLGGLGWLSWLSWLGRLTEFC